MKKFMNITIMLVILAIITFNVTSFAASLDTIDIQTDKTTVRPGEEVTVNIEFGQELGAYTFNIFYDDNIFEYVGVEGGTANDTTQKVNVVYFDSTGGSNPRTNMSITFRAKSDIVTSNPTEFTITAEGLSNADASVIYDDITTPIVKNVIVEPEYENYKIQLEYPDKLVKEIENEMTISISSSMGHYYEHARLIVEATTPDGANVQLLATDQAGLEHDLVQSGWGDAQGYEIGGENYYQLLNVKGIFSEDGMYTITFKLIDRANSDQEIDSNTFALTVGETLVTTPPDNIDTPVGEITTPETQTPENQTQESVGNVNQTQNTVPTTLPKTGNNIYVPAIVIIAILIASYVYYNKKEKRK